MGSPPTEVGRFNSVFDETLHHVRITRPFMMGAYLVTRAEFRAFAEATDYKTAAEKAGGAPVPGPWRIVAGASWRAPGFDQTERDPVVQVSWEDAVAFCAWLSKKESRAYRLPTEAEWEYCCRAGTQTRFPWGDTEGGGEGRANVSDQDYKRAYPYEPGYFPFHDGFVFTSPVGTFKESLFGLYDMIGNVNEWCNDYYGPYNAAGPVDPKGPPTGKLRVVRGGSWDSWPPFCRSASRNRRSPRAYNAAIGFRACLEPRN